jgi:uncharacterized protein (UPF0261 family)
VVLIPDGGVSALDAPGQPFDDPRAREALTTALLAELDSDVVSVVRTSHHINAPEFADLAADTTLGLLSSQALTSQGTS